MPDRIVEINGGYHISSAPLWTKNPFNTKRPTSKVLPESSFPPKWRRLCGILFNNYRGTNEQATVWNKRHPLVQAVTEASWNWAVQTVEKTSDPLLSKDFLCKDVSKAAAWVLHFIQSDLWDIWAALPERDPEFLEAVWNLLGLRDAVYLWLESSTNQRLRKISPNGWDTFSDKSETRRYMPPAGFGWTIDTNAVNTYLSRL